MKTVAILQSNYIPWKGYFRIIKQSSDFVFYDSVQFTKNDWRNRNQIMSPNGLVWLTIPVGQKISRSIDQVTIDDSAWQKKHFKSLQFSYQKAPHFKDYEDFLKEVYLERKWTRLSELNQFLIKEISQRFLNLSTRFHQDRDFPLEGDPTEKLVQIVSHLKGDRYLSGPSAKDYLDEAQFTAADIELEYVNYDFSEYPTIHPEFTHQVSIWDLLFHKGPDSSRYL